MRAFNKGDKVICTVSGVVGTVVRFYIPTACEEQTLVNTSNGKQYHAPTRTWRLYTDGLKPNNIIYDEKCEAIDRNIVDYILTNWCTIFRENKI